MTLEQFIATLDQPAPPIGLSPLLEALWQDKKGNWQAAHTIAQGAEGTAAFDRLHAYLHRKEGDESNARYWYRRAGAAEFNGTLDQEWESIVRQSL